MGIRIDELDSVLAALNDHVIPAMRSGVTVKLTVAQILELLIDAAPGALDTINELAAAIGDDANFAATMTTALAAKADDASVVRHDLVQALTAIQQSQARSNIGGANPAGEVAFFAMNSAPAGWLKANGAAISRTTYASLFAAIGTTFGVGDGSTTFNIPDLRAEFLRGWDDSRGVDSGRAFGSAQSSANLAHTHVPAYYGNGFTLNGGGSNRRLTFTSDGSTVDIDTTSSGGAEARPRNIALLACIKH